MNAGQPSPQSARWVAALLISGVGLAGVGYSLATKPTPQPQPVVFVPQQLEARAGAPVTQAPTATPAPVQLRAATTERPGPGAASEPDLRVGMTIDINTASADRLELLPGIGPSRAAAIIESRQSVGPFRTVEDLARVHGIGPATVEGVRPYVRIEAAVGGQ
ncbi:MAG: helix-hairpin-helix domain-containing protein [Phycisphaerales bacterium JB060]